MKPTTIQFYLKLGFYKKAYKHAQKAKSEQLSLSSIKRLHKDSPKEYNEKYAIIAKNLYPKNTWGYVSLANHYIGKKDYAKATKALIGSPRSAQVTKLKKSLVNHSAKKQNTQIANKANSNSKPAAKATNQDTAASYSIATPPNPEQLEEMFKSTKSKLAHLVSKFPNHLLKGLSAHVVKSKATSEQGLFTDSLNTLMVAQAKHPGDRRILFLISDLFKNDRQVSRAYIYMLAGEANYPSYGAVKRLSFEVDAGLIPEAEETLARILEFKQPELIKFISIINRVSVFLGGFDDELVALRKRLKSFIVKRNIKGAKDYNKQIELCLINRWIPEAELISSKALKNGITISDNTNRWLEKARELVNIGSTKSNKPILEWLEMASHNESNESLIGWAGGLTVQIDDKICEENTTVELFIPNGLFSDPEKEKPTFQSVNKVFIKLFSLLIQDDIVVIPRHQYNWRYCKPKTNAKVISYHTVSNEEETNRMHIQESVFAGLCSLDDKGFAGFASIATDYSKITQHCEDISLEYLNAHRDHLYSRYVENNVSKYTQVEESADIEGDYIFVALQVFTDPVSELAHLTGVEMLNTLANYYADKDVRVVVKRHPYCNSMTVQKETEKLFKNGLIEISNASIHSLIANAEAVFTVNSGVGLESLIHLKPVIVTGACDYAYGVHSHVKSVSELTSVLDIGFEDIDTTKMLQFLHYYNNSYIGDVSNLPQLCISTIKQTK